ncbi:MAG: hypothetical protein AABY32_01085 [Nanoarchaeota archaeon]
MNSSDKWLAGTVIIIVFLICTSLVTGYIYNCKHEAEMAEKGYIYVPSSTNNSRWEKLKDINKQIVEKDINK